MPYSIVKSQTTARFGEVNHLLNTIKNIEDQVVPPSVHPLEYKILKGLFYVHLYACIEFTVTSLVLNTLSLIKGKNVIYQHIETVFNTVALSSNLQSIRDCNSKFFLDKSSDLFLKLNSAEILAFDETFIQKYMQNIWGKTFNQLTKTLGLSTFAISPQAITVFDEIVDNRNKVAHGRESVEAVGSSPKYKDLKAKYDLIYEVLNLYIEHFEKYYNQKQFILSNHRAEYL